MKLMFALIQLVIMAECVYAAFTKIPLDPFQVWIGIGAAWGALAIQNLEDC